MRFPWSKNKRKRKRKRKKPIVLPSHASRKQAKKEAKQAVRAKIESLFSKESVLQKISKALKHADPDRTTRVEIGTVGVGDWEWMENIMRKYGEFSHLIKAHFAKLLEEARPDLEEYGWGFSELGVDRSSRTLGSVRRDQEKYFGRIWVNVDGLESDSGSASSTESQTESEFSAASASSSY